jgi:predicted transposase YbfD/YdcC
VASACTASLHAGLSAQNGAGSKVWLLFTAVAVLWNKETMEVRYFLSSLEADAAAFAGYIRAHWGIENQLHWCLDVVFGEDASRIRKDHAPRNVSLLRRLGPQSSASRTLKRQFGDEALPSRT